MPEFPSPFPRQPLVTLRLTSVAVALELLAAIDDGGAIDDAGVDEGAATELGASEDAGVDDAGVDEAITDDAATELGAIDDATTDVDFPPPPPQAVSPKVISDNQTMYLVRVMVRIPLLWFIVVVNYTIRSLSCIPLTRFRKVNSLQTKEKGESRWIRLFVAVVQQEQLFRVINPPFVPVPYLWFL